MTASHSNAWLYAAAARLIPPIRKYSVIEYAEKHLRDPGSARSEKFDASITPWVIAPANCYGDGETRVMVFCKPIQSGGSKVGEAVIAYDIDHSPGGDIAYYWPNDEKADDRWIKRVERLLRNTGPIKQRMADLMATDKGRFKIVNGRIVFPHLTLAMLGAYKQRNVESDSYRLIVCEEVHDNDNNTGWLPGRLAQAFGRATAYWNSYIMVISNASIAGDQLHIEYLGGSQEHWQAYCPGCSNPHHEANTVHHIMQTRWTDERPDLGGLRYDSKACKRDDGSYDYLKLESTIRFQMPCGFIVHDAPQERRPLSIRGQYSAPQNTGAQRGHRSFTLQAVSVDYIPWITLVKEKHEALRAMRYGDPEPWKRYVQERECDFYDATNRPLTTKLTLNRQAKKSRDGLKDRVLRGMSIDKQRGRSMRQEAPHYVVVIRDFLATAASQLVFEGKLETIEQVEDIRIQYGVVANRWDKANPLPSHVLIDSGYEASEVYRICDRYGYTALKGSPAAFFPHDILDPNTGEKIGSEKRIYSTLIETPVGDRHIAFHHYSKQGIADRLAWLQSRGRSLDEELNDQLEEMFGKDPQAVKFWAVPSDVSEEYKRHLEAEQLQIHIVGKSQEKVALWTAVVEGAPNDFLMCERYLALLAEMTGLIGTEVEQ